MRRYSITTLFPPVALVVCFLICPTWADQGSIADADALFAAGEWNGARTAYAELTEADPQLGSAWFGLGRSSLQLEEYEGALEAFARAIELGHQIAFAMFGSARAHAALGHRDQAIEWLFKMSETGATGSLAAVSTPELAKLSDHPRYEEALHALRPCRSAEHRQFDFWLGDWDVTNQAGPQRPPSHNRISSREGGCIVLEEYDTPSGYSGVSISFYDPNRKQWHQTWMDNQGQPILHSGGMRDGRMVLVDDPEGQTQNRTTWTPMDEEKVRQHWEFSDDGGKTWSTVFDGLCTRRKSG